MNICPKCGLPSEACVCKEISKTNQEIQIRTEKRKLGKIMTVVTGLKDVDIKEIASRLKSELACGGTVKNNAIELQGKHQDKIKPLLKEMGFEVEIK